MIRALALAAAARQERRPRTRFHKPYVYRGKPVQRARRYDQLAAGAHKARRGVWGRCGGDFHSGG